MKRFFCYNPVLVIAAVLLAVFIPASAQAHPGRTDMYGGHTDSSTGIYHYHHGHTAHQHPDGVCPYGDYEEWLAQNGVQTGYWSEELSAVAQTAAQGSANVWGGVGIGVGAAAASALGYGVYRKNKKKQVAIAHTGAIIEYDPHMTVFVAGNSSRYHKVEGCCNAIGVMELEDALKEGRTPCPACCDDAFIEYTVTLAGNEPVLEETPETVSRNDAEEVSVQVMEEKDDPA